MGKNLHTPLVLRTGFLYSYKRTLLVWVPLYVAIWIVNFILGYSEWFIGISTDVIITLVILLGTWTMRKVVYSYHEMFGLFEPDITMRLSVTRDFAVDEKIEPNKIQHLFTSADSYEKYKRKAGNILFGKTEIWVLILVGITCFSYILYYFATPSMWSAYGDYVVFWTPVRQILGIVILFPIIVISAVSGLFFIFSYFRLVRLLETSMEDFSVWDNIRSLESESDKFHGSVTYYRFYNDIAIVGRQIYEVTFQAVVTLVVGLLWYINFISFIALASWIMSGIIIPVAFFIFILPQINLHSILAKVKEAELQFLENEHDSIKVKFLSHLRTQSGSDVTRSRLDPFERNCLCTEMNTLKDLIHDTRGAPTWSFRMPTTLKLLGTSILPFLATIFQQVIAPVLIP